MRLPRPPLLDRYLVRAYVPPFLAAFSVVLFLLVVQFLMQYRDTIFGKGFSPWVIAQLFFYASVQLMTLALPISVLMASLMTYGNLAESRQLMAIKAAGVSLTRLYLPVLVLALGLTAGALLLTSNLVPKANLKLYSLLYDASQTKPAFALKPGFFNTLIPGHAIYVQQRDESGLLHGIKIYNHTDNRGNTQVMVAQRGWMEQDPTTQYLVLHLQDGAKYEQLRETNEDQPVRPFSRVRFDSIVYKLDMSGFGLKRSDESAFTTHYYMLSLNGLKHVADSLAGYRQREADHLAKYFRSFLPYPERLAGPQTALPDSLQLAQLLPCLPPAARVNAIQKVLTNARSMRSYVDASRQQLKYRFEDRRKYLTEYHMRLAMPVACLVLFFIGAPLGAIIRKGGVGTPVLVSLGFFVVYYVLLTNGKKLAREGATPVWAGVWMPIYLMAPLAAWMSIQAARDARLSETLNGLVKAWLWLRHGLAPLLAQGLARVGLGRASKP